MLNKSLKVHDVFHFLCQILLLHNMSYLKLLFELFDLIFQELLTLFNFA